MNLILLAFETMWRVVFHCFIEVRYRGVKEQDEWMAILKVYLTNPGSQQDMPYSIIREALRLYLPTRYIYRYFEFASGCLILAIADIEGLYRNTEIWGSDADCFKPSRWARISHESEQLRAWMPFGASLFLCPAKPDFAPRMVGVLVAALAEAFCDVKYELRVEGLFGRMDIVEFYGPLRSERNSYQDLFLEEYAPCGG